ncbi:MAG: transglycosylase SLT domain-containing protein [Candidatus Aminicenantes bacterium]|nr:transglycosylase SLT domain-containing protein [Candidatus Aminicenantes bacterium]
MKTIKKGFGAFLLLVLAPCVFSATAADLRKLYDPVIKKVADKYRIDPTLVHIIIRAESNYDSFAISDKGAMGLMQLMPATAKQYGVNNVFDSAQNIEGGIRYLGELVRLYDGQTRLVLAAYNAGQEAVRKYKGIPPYPETKAYIAGIMKSYQKPSVRTGNPTYMVKDASGRTHLVNNPDSVRRE